MSVDQLIGHTPVIELTNCSPKPGIRLFAKLEGQNPTGSIKDRIVSRIIREARSEGRLAPGQEIVEATTGNTGIALAAAGKRLGHPVKLVVPETAFADVRQALLAWEPQIVWVSPTVGIRGAIETAKNLVRNTGAFALNQFESSENVRCHYETTGVEIARQRSDVDVFVCGLGTGGTASGVSRRLKEVRPDVQVVAAEPYPGQVVQGIRSLDDGYLPPLLDLSLLDAKVLVRSADAFRAMRELLRREGLLAGPSSGAALHAALKYVQRLERANVVVMFADAGWKYVNSPAFQLEDKLEGKLEELDEVLWW